MSLIINIDTATERGTVCIAKDGRPIATKLNDHQQDHAAMLAPLIAQMMEELCLKPTQIDAIAVSGGPGSYTGLRVATATAKGLCYAWNKPLIAINTLAQMAAGMFEELKEDQICYAPMIDARRQEVFTAVYDAQLQALLPPQSLILTPHSFEAFLKNQPICFFGNGSQKWQSLLGKHPLARFETYTISADHLAPLAERSFQLNDFQDLPYFEPFYLKPFYQAKAPQNKGAAP